LKNSDARSTGKSYAANGSMLPRSRPSDGVVPQILRNGNRTQLARDASIDTRNLHDVYSIVTILAFTVGHSPRQYSSFHKRLNALVRELPGLARGRVEALPRTRVASRRLREVLPLLPLDHNTARKLTRRLRKVTQRLGPARELDVQALLIAELQQDRRYPVTALKKVPAAVVQARDEAREHLAATLPTAKLKRLAERLARAGKPFESPTKFRRLTGSTRASLWAVEARLTRRAAVARTAIERAGALYVPDRLHDVRIAIKKLR